MRERMKGLMREVEFKGVLVLTHAGLLSLECFFRGLINMSHVFINDQW